MKTLRKEALAGYQRALVARLLALQGAQASDRAVLEADHRLGTADLPTMALYASETEVTAVLVYSAGQ